MSQIEQQNTQDNARIRVIQSDHIENDIRQLVIQALQEGKIEPEAIKQTLHAFIDGACAGLADIAKASGSAFALISSDILVGFAGSLKPQK